MKNSKFFILVFSSLLFAQNVGVETSGGVDLFPWIVKDSKGNLYVVSEDEIVKGDWDVHIAKSTNKGLKWSSAMGSGWPLSYPWVSNRRPGIIIGKRDSIYIFPEGPYKTDTIVDNNFFWIVSVSGGGGWSPATYIRNTAWYKDCTYPVGADRPPSERLIVFECDTNPKNPDILGFYFVKGDTLVHIINIAKSSKPERYPCIAPTPDGFIVAYEYYDNGWDIQALKVVGGNPGLPLSIATEPGIDERQPYLASSGDYVYCAYSRGDDIYIAYSTDGGNSFESVPVAVSEDVEHWPAVACKEKIVDVAYYHGTGNIYHQRSMDNGRTWTRPDIVTTQPTAVDTPRVSILYDDTCHIVWVDNRNEKGNLDIYYGRPGQGGTTGIENSDEEISSLRVSPNPSKGSIVITYQLSEKGGVSLLIYDALGRKVKELWEDTGLGHRTEGLEHRVCKAVWDGRDREGHRVPSGVYFICLRTDKRTDVRRVVLIK